MANIPESLPNYTKNDYLLNEMETLYSYILDSIGLNQSDPISATVGYFNNFGRIYADPQKVGRTRVYITRPNLNLRSIGNIERCRILNYCTSSKLNMTLSRFLMYPEIIKNINFGGLYPGDTKDSSKTDATWKSTGSLVGTAWDACVGRYGTRPELEKTYRINSTNGLQDGDDIVKLGYSYPIDATPFIPVLSNLCTETGSGKDIMLETEQTDPNFSGNHLVYGSGINESRGPGEVTLSFEDIYGSPVFYLILIWVYYIHYVAKGVCNPERAYVVNRIIDYSCSIYIFMLDTDQKTIIRATKYTGCFPKMIPFSNIMHGKEIDIQSLSKFSIPFQYNFASPMDPIIFKEFNMISECALVNRTGSGVPNSVYGITDSWESAAAFFFGRNHHLTEKEALYFRNTWKPNLIPGKLLSPKWDIERATDMTPYKGYNQLDADKMFGDTSDIDYGHNRKVGGHEAFEHYQVGDYRGYLGDVLNYRAPYIVDGNKLMYL